MRELPRSRDAQTIHSVLDNLNTHFETSFIETFGTREAKRMLSRRRFHDTPTHASWLTRAEIEIGSLSRQSIRGRIPTEAVLSPHARFWQQARNQARAMISGKFTVRDAQAKFHDHEGSKLH
jgi:hypothetical protein